MGKGLNPADAERKAQKKKDIAKFKKQRAETNEVRQLLSDPDRIDEQLQNLKKESESNKLDLNLKNKIKEMQKMKDIAVKKLENQKILDQMKANSLRGIQEAERHDKSLKSNINSSVKTDHQHHQPRSGPPHQTPRSLLVGGLHGVPLPPPPIIAGPRPILQNGMMPFPHTQTMMPPGMMHPMPGMMPPGMMPPMPGIMPPGMMPPMPGMMPQGMMPLMPGMMPQGMMPPIPGMHPAYFNHMQQVNSNPRPQKRQNRATSNIDPIDPMDPKGENYVERFIGHDKLQKQQQLNQRLQIEKQQQQLLQEEQIQKVQRIEDNDNKWSQFETDFEQVETETDGQLENEMSHEKWSKFETQMDESQNGKESQIFTSYEVENETTNDPCPAFEIPNVNPDDIMKRRFASAENTASPDASINIEELMRRRNMIPENDESLDVGPSLGPSVPAAPYEMYQSLQSLPTVEDLLQDRHNEEDGVEPSPNIANEGGLLGLCQYDSDDDADDKDSADNYNSQDNDVSNNKPQYVLNIPLQSISEIEQKKTAPIKIKADAELTSFKPSSLKMKRPNPNPTASKSTKSTPINNNATPAVGDLNNKDDHKDDAYAKFLAEITGL